MGGSTYNSRRDEITRAYYGALREVNPSACYSVQRRNGSHVYYTYHLNQYSV